MSHVTTLELNSDDVDATLYVLQQQFGNEHTQRYGSMCVEPTSIEILSGRKPPVHSDCHSYPVVIGVH